VRFAAAGLAILAACVVQISMFREPPSEQGQVHFITLSILAFAYCLVSGVLTTSDCVSEEKRDGTLGLLFLTNLRGFDVVIGKWVANSVRAILALLALLPVLRVPMLMGGVSADAAWCAAAVLLNTMFLSLALGVLVSVITRDARHAVGGTIFLLFLLLAVFPLLRWVLVEYVLPAHVAGTAARGLSNVPRPLAWMLMVNPLLPLAGTMDVLVRGGKPQEIFWIPLAVQHGMAWMALITACVVLPRVWQDRVQKRPVRATGSEPLQVQWQMRASLLNESPCAWIVARDRRAGVLTWVGLAVIAACWLWGFAEMDDEWLQGFVGLWTLFFGAFWLKLRLASAACRHLHEQRRSGALELVLCTSLTPCEIVQGNLRGLRRIMVGPLAAVVGAGFLLMLAAQNEARGSGSGVELLLTFLVGLGTLVLDLLTIAWAGMWNGLRAQRYVRAYAQTLGWVLALPWALFIVSFIALGVTLDFLGLLESAFEPTFSLMVLWWALISIAVDGWIMVRARRGLNSGLRDITAESYAPVKSIRAAPRAAGTPIVKTA
jgi:hypothetical protein